MENNLIDLKDIGKGFIGSSVWFLATTILTYFFNWLNKVTATSKFSLNGLRITSLALSWIIFNAIYLYFSFPYPIAIAIITFIGFIGFSWYELGQFAQVGLIGTDKTVKKGLDYEESLKLCTNELAFLGIGASKLTVSKEFDNAIKRCNRPNNPIRFLLTKPDNPLLVDAAKQKGVKPEEYSRKVEKSLEKLAELKKDREVNIEVRFYPSENKRDFPIFRLMFIDDSICLLSYNVFGEGEGSQLPQLHLKKFQDRRDVESFYYPFRLFYDHLWNESSPWDFEIPVK